jgi:negative regulator of sigma-B (phosphoserine phosphatase)
VIGTWPAALQRGTAGRPLDGEGRSGDLAVFAPYDGGALAACIDGLGHGDDAADASAAAAEILAAHAGEAPQALLQRCHEALHRTRGVVMTLAWFDVAGATMTWTGVGNVEGRLVRAAGDLPGRHDSPVVFGGVVGYQLPRVKPTTVALEPGDTVVFATDGISPAFSVSLTAGLEPQVQADRVLEHHARDSDDALAVAVRFLPEPS